MVGPINLSIGGNSPTPSPAPASTPASTPTPTPAPTQDLPPIELDPIYDAVIQVREHESGGGLIQMEFGRAMVTADWDDLKRFNSKRNIQLTVDPPSIQYGRTYDGKQVAKQLEKILRRRGFSSIHICYDCPGAASEKMSTLM